MTLLSPHAAVGLSDRPGARPFPSRSVVHARRGMVATSHPLASQIGLDVLVDFGIGLVRRGHTVQDATAPQFGGYQAVARDPDTGVLSGATEWRKDGCAAED